MINTQKSITFYRPTMNMKRLKLETLIYNCAKENEIFKKTRMDSIY